MKDKDTPIFIFYKNKIYVNQACIKQLPDIEFVQLLIHQKRKQLMVLPCVEGTSRSYRWCSLNEKRYSRHISCPVLSAKVQALMNWPPQYQYKLKGEFVEKGMRPLFLFDLTDTEVYEPDPESGKLSSVMDRVSGSEKSSEALLSSAGRKELPIRIFDDHIVFDI